MLRTVLVGTSRTLPATMREVGGSVQATMFPAYVSGATDYRTLANKPTINGVVLEGDLTLADLGICEAQASEIDALFYPIPQ